jgi:hypothetical protein
MVTIRTYKNNGPYWASMVMKYQASCLRDVLFHVRMAMEDGEDTIGAFNEDNVCYGIWENDAEPEPDGEGDWLMPGPMYVLRRPGGKAAKTFVRMAKKMEQAA